MAQERKSHKTLIESDEEVEVLIGGDKRSAWWFKMLHCWVESGWWAALPGSACKVLVALAKHANRDWLCWPGLSLLMSETGLDRGTVYRSIAHLEACGLVERKARGYGKKKTIYELITEPKPPRKTVSRNEIVTQAPPVAPMRQSRLSPEMSRQDESSLYRRNRSTSEPEEIEPRIAARRTEQDPAVDWAMTLTDDEVLAFTKLARERISEAQRNLLPPHKTVRNSKSLALAAYQFVLDDAM